MTKEARKPVPTKALLAEGIAKPPVQKLAGKQISENATGDHEARDRGVKRRIPEITRALFRKLRREGKQAEVSAADIPLVRNREGMMVQSSQYREFLEKTGSKEMASMLYERIKKLDQTTFRNSVVRDENGELLIVWHQTTKDFDKFDFSKSRSGGTLYFSEADIPNYRSVSGILLNSIFMEGFKRGRSIVAVLNFENPLIVNKTENPKFLFGVLRKKQWRTIEEGKHDGIIGYANILYDKKHHLDDIKGRGIDKRTGTRSVEIAALNPEQVYIIGRMKRDKFIPSEG